MLSRSFSCVPFVVLSYKIHYFSYLCYLKLTCLLNSPCVTSAATSLSCRKGPRGLFNPPSNFQSGPSLFFAPFTVGFPSATNSTHLKYNKFVGRFTLLETFHRKHEQQLQKYCDQFPMMHYGTPKQNHFSHPPQHSLVQE